MQTAVETPQATPTKSAITLGHLKHALKVVGAAIKSRTTIPILSCLRMEQLEEGFAIEATDLDIAIRALVPESNGPATPLLTPAKKLTDWAKLLVGDDVKISTTAGRATLQCGRSRAIVPTMDPANWPQLTFKIDGEAATFAQGSFVRALRFVAIAVSDDASRLSLNAVLIQSDGDNLTLVATDGHRMIVYTLPCTEKIEPLLLPSAFVSALLPLLSDNEDGVDVAFNANTILASIASDTPVFVAAKKIQGSFPAWKTLFPRDKRIAVTVDAAELLSSLERCALLTDPESGAITLTFKQSEIVIEGTDAQSGEATETLSCSGAIETPLRMRLSVVYLIDLVKKLSGPVSILVPGDPMAALLLKAEPHQGEVVDYVVMPMRV